MKTKPTFLLLFIAAVCLLSFADPYSVKRISDNNFRYEFYTTQKTPTPSDGKVYYWFKGGAIHNAVGGISGELLDGPFNKMYLSNQLAEQGAFKKGLKAGTWKTWYANGMIESIQRWSKGSRCGKYLHYAENGNLQEKGRYRNDLKTGKWIAAATNDTVAYRKGIPVPKKQPLTKAEKAAARENKEKQKAAAKAAKSSVSNTKASMSKNADQGKKKDNFFKRLFHKKDPKNQKNGKGA